MVSLIDLLQLRDGEQGGKTAFTFLRDGEEEESSRTYAELAERARGIGAWLQQTGLAGERVLLLFPPGLDFIEAFFGCLCGGAIAVPVQPPGSRRSLPRLLSVVRDARPAIALTKMVGLHRQLRNGGAPAARLLQRPNNRRGRKHWDALGERKRRRVRLLRAQAPLAAR